MDVEHDHPVWNDWWDADLEITSKIDRERALRLQHAPFLLTARDPQRPPADPWRTWLFMGGRGAGKTRAGAEWTRFAARFGGYGSIAQPAGTRTLSDEDIGRTLLAQIGSGEVLPFEYQDRASLPWRVGHLRSRIFNGEHFVSWTGRGSQFSNNWELAEVEHDQQYVIELYLNDTLVSRAIQSETELGVSLGAADTVRVAIMSAQGRVGEWGSIPV